MTNIETQSVTVRWVVESVTEQQEYTVIYGLTPFNLDRTSAVVSGVADTTLTNQEYSVALTGLTDSTLYYFRVIATFGSINLMSELSSFRTLDLRKYLKFLFSKGIFTTHIASFYLAPSGPPENVNTTVDGVSITIVWNPPPVGNSILASVTLNCSVNGEQVLNVVLNPIQQFTLEELNPSTTYMCILYGSTTGGDGPSASFTAVTEGSSCCIFSGYRVHYYCLPIDCRHNKG